MGAATLRLRMTLLSDTIFGSGYSIPGGEDIAVRRDNRGYPCLGGSTLKGLLRESLENLLAWTGEDPETASVLLGQEDFAGTASPRRLRLTPLVLEDPPADPEECFSYRAFTSLEEDRAREGSLRTAACVRAGLVFAGTLTCDREDLPLLRDALAGIKWAGTMCSRGFGRVRVTVEAPVAPAAAEPLREARCIRYRLRLQAPVVITDPGRSWSGGTGTRDYITGAAVRGMALDALAAREPVWFAAHRAELLSPALRFTDALPVREGLIPLPAMRGFYEDKEEQGLTTVLRDGSVPAGYKRARLGSCCAPQGDTLRCWTADTQGTTRIQRPDGEETKDNEIFQTRYLCPGQELEGYIFLERPEWAERLTAALPGTIWLGADRFAGFGQCSLSLFREESPRYLQEYGETSPGRVLTMLALSPLTMLDELGEPCGLDLKEGSSGGLYSAQLAALLGVGSVRLRHCGTAAAGYGGYNRLWQSRQPTLQMYDRGSVFRLECDRSPDPAALAALQWSGLGARREEGFGQLLFLREGLIEALRQKDLLPPPAAARNPAAAAVRQAGCRWVMEQSAALAAAPLSRSQLGTLQALCEGAMAGDGDPRAVKEWLDKSLNRRGSRHGSRFVNVSELIDRVVGTPLSDTLGVPCDDSRRARLRLLCALFDYSRKERGREED